MKINNHKCNNNQLVCSHRHFVISSLLLLLFFVCSVTGQNIPIKFKHLASQDGLSQATVPFIFKDKLGLMWIATFDGLNKYDGSEMTLYEHDPDNIHSISNNVIKKIYEDEDSNLWISTSDGLNFFDRKNNQFNRFYHEEENDNSLSHNHLTEIIGDKEGNIWIGTLEGFLNKYNTKTKTFTRYPPPSLDRSTKEKIEDINYLYIDQFGNFWIAYLRGGIALFEPKTGRYDLIEELYSDKETWCIKEDSRGNFWVGTDGEGLKLFDRNTRKVRQFMPDDHANSISNHIVWSIAEDNEEQLVLGTEGGLNILNLDDLNQAQVDFRVIQHDPLNYHGLSSNFIRYVYHDTLNNVTWLGTTETGIDLWDRDTKKMAHYHANGTITNKGSINILNHKVVWSIWDDPEAYTWIGTSAGFNRLHRPSGEIIFYFPDANNPTSISAGRCWNILQESKNVYWVGTSTGLNRMTLDANHHPSFELYKGTLSDTISSNSIRSMYRDNRGQFWVGTNRGLNLFDPNNNTFKAFYHEDDNSQSLSNHYIRSILQDKKGRLWIATSEGLNLYDYENETFSAFLHAANDATSLSHSKTRCILEDQQGQLWIGTSGGLNKMIEKEGKISFKYYTEKEGLPNNTVYAILEDDVGMLWVSTNKGLARFDPIQEKFTNLSLEDGLQDLEFNSNTCFKNKKGELFFGGVNGFNVFYPQQIQRDSSYDKVILSEFRLNNDIVQASDSDILSKDIHLAKDINLTYVNKLFAIKYSALSFLKSKDLEYAYFLKGWDKKWNYVGAQTMATYTNIPPGEYEFQVKAANQIGGWDTQPAKVSIHIEPAFWQTPWFTAFMILGGCLLIYYISTRRVRRLHERQLELEARVKERTETLHLQNKELEKTYQDLHLQKEELEKTHENLKHTQAQLLQSEKMASLGQLTAGIAHEINNPINFVAANVHALKLDFNDIQLILDKIKGLSPNGNAKQELEEVLALYRQMDTDYLNEEVTNLISGIQRGAKRTQNIVKSLRSFSRNTNDEWALADLHEGLDSTLTILKSQFRDRIQVHKNYANLPLVNCQIGKINQVFLNIINNAIQAIEGEGDIFIQTEQVQGQGQGQVLIRIRDNGKGIEAAILQRIFDPFFTKKEIGKGTGLGLTISYNIVEQHHGKIKVTSEVGVGTEFVVMLPI